MPSKTSEVRICGFDPCAGEAKARGLCKTHWSQQKRGKPLTAIAKTPEERFWRRVRRASERECWDWTGGDNGVGHGKFYVNGKYTYVYRYSYELYYGPIPEGLEVDHQCRNPRCVNPHHLKAVTHKENMENRGINKNNMSGYRGVSWNSEMNKWEVRVGHNWGNYRGIYFDNVHEAGAKAVELRNTLYTNNVEEL